MFEVSTQMYTDTLWSRDNSLLMEDLEAAVADRDAVSIVFTIENGHTGEELMDTIGDETMVVRVDG